MGFLRYFILEGVFSSFYILIIQGAIFTGLAIEFHLNEFLLGITSSFPLISQIFQMVVPLILERVKSRKFLTNLFNLLGRFSWIGVLISLALNIKNPKIFILIFAISQIFGAMASSSWISWMRDLIPEDKRGSIFGKRNVYISLTSLSVFYMYSFLIEKITFGYEIVILISLLGSFLSYIYMQKIPDVPMKRYGTMATLKLILRDENFVRYLMFVFYWYMVVMITSPFYNYHLIKNIGVPFSYIGLASVISSCVAIVMYKIWGRVSDEAGHRVVAELGISVVGMISIMWFFMNEGTYRYLMILDAVLTGFAWSAINLSLLTLPLEVASSSEIMYFSVNAAVAGVGGLAGSVIGGILARNFSRLCIEPMGFKVQGLQILFLLGGILRLSSLLFLTRVRVKRHVPIRAYIFNALSVVARRSIIRPTEYNGSIIVNRVKELIEKRKREIEEARRWRLRRWW